MGYDGALGISEGMINFQLNMLAGEGYTTVIDMEDDRGKIKIINKKIIKREKKKERKEKKKEKRRSGESKETFNSTCLPERATPP